MGSFIAEMQSAFLLCIFSPLLRETEQPGDFFFFGTFKNPRQPAVNDPETKGAHSEQNCHSTHPSYFEHSDSSKQTLSLAPASETIVYP